MRSPGSATSLVIAILFFVFSLCGVRSASAQRAVVNGPLRLQIDAPAPAATVLVPFGLGGWAIDQAAANGTGIDAVHVWAVPAGGAPIFAGAATMGVARPDVAAIFGAQFQPSGFNVAVNAPLAPGVYMLAVFGRRVSTGTLPYQITRYCDQKKYIHMIDMANCSLATSCTAAGGTVARPRAFARIVRIDSRQNAV